MQSLNELHINKEVLKNNDKTNELQMTSTPRALGFTHPPEWFPHEATWLSWPHRESSWPGKFDPVPSVFIEIVRFLCTQEKVNIIVTGREMEIDIRKRVEQSGILNDAVSNIFYHHFRTNDAWCRDHAPSFLVRNNGNNYEKSVVNWGYNAWGGKYPPYDLDNAIPEKIAQLKNLQIFNPNMILEGGSIDVNGDGCLLTTTACLLHENRNPTMSKEDIEGVLKEYMGVEKILWLGDGIVGDDTDGHIDDIARFISPTKIVFAVEENKHDENYDILQENFRLIKTFTDNNNKPFEIIPIPMPSPIEFEGERLPASYANFYIANNVVLVPTFRCANDERALEILQKHFPTRRVQGVDCYDLILGLGAIHCVTHEEPTGEVGRNINLK